MDEHRSHGPALKFQSTHPARGATAPHHRPVSLCFYFNPRTPRGVRRIFTAIRPSGRSFQSTHPARGATVAKSSKPGERKNFNPRTPRGVRLIEIGLAVLPENFNPRTPRGVRRGGTDLSGGAHRISIHAPREGCDFFLCCPKKDNLKFQSTHPARGATPKPWTA